MGKAKRKDAVLRWDRAVDGGRRQQGADELVERARDGAEARPRADPPGVVGPVGQLTVSRRSTWASICHRTVLAGQSAKEWHSYSSGSVLHASR